MSSTPSDSSFIEPQSLEIALKRLEEIVSSIESNPPPLELLVQRYEEGALLLKYCKEKLSAAEQKIEIISHSSGTVRPFGAPSHHFSIE